MLNELIQTLPLILVTIFVAAAVIYLLYITKDDPLETAKTNK